MICLVLAAGYATRLYPLTENYPKPLLDVGGKTILDWLVDDIDGAGCIDEYVVISNHKFVGHFRNWAAGKKQKMVVVDDGTLTNGTRLGAVRDIQFAIDSLALDDDMLVIAGDNVLDFSLQSFVLYSKQKGTSCIMRYYEPDERRLNKCGVVTVDADDRITSMEESRLHRRAIGAVLRFISIRAETLVWCAWQLLKVAVRMRREVSLHGFPGIQASMPWKCRARAMTSAILKATTGLKPYTKALYGDS